MARRISVVATISSGDSPDCDCDCDCDCWEAAPVDTSIVARLFRCVSVVVVGGLLSGAAVCAASSLSPCEVPSGTNDKYGEHV